MDCLDSKDNMDVPTIAYNVTSGDNYTYTTNHSLEEFWEYRVNKLLMLYVPPILIIIGTFGNTFSFIILRRRVMTKVSSYLYLASLAAVDCVVLYVGLLKLWLAEFTGNSFHNS